MDHRHYKKKIGDIGEDLAAKYLRKKGFKIVEKKYSCPIGEVDIIALDDDVLVFVEVKTRTPAGLDPLESVTYKKRKKIGSIAKYYCTKLTKDTDIRFDIIGITLHSKKADIEHIENAFSIV